MITYAAKERLCEYLIRRVIECASGTGPDGQLCLYERPRDVYFIGSLSPCGAVPDPEETANNEYFARFAPPALGLDVLVARGSNFRLEVTIRFNVYYRVFPSYEQQTRIPGMGTFAVAFRRLRVATEPLVIRREHFTDGRAVYEGGVSEIADALRRVRRAIETDPDTFCVADKVMLPQVLDLNEFAAAVARAKTGDRVIPEWSIALEARIRPWSADAELLTLTLVNTSEDRDPKGVNKLTDEFIFDAGIDLAADCGVLRPFEFELLPDSYRFDRTMWGIGHNCVVEYSAADGRDVLHTVSAAISRQPRFLPRTVLPDGSPLTDLSFDRLIADPVGTLRLLETDMRRYLDYWRSRGREIVVRKTGCDPAAVSEELERILNEFEREIDRFRQGITLLDDPQHGHALQAFRLMNQTFRVLGAGGRMTAWRPFQIVFIVSNLPDLVALCNRAAKYPHRADCADVLWYPTGGGKTEAYLGLTVWNLFFDRLRGKNSGVTAIYRFPLRLLSLQQFHRVVRAVAAAEKVRRESGLPGEPFSIGHWVAEDQSPNSVRSREEAEWLKQRLKDERVREKYRRFRHCPYCGARDSVDVEWDENGWRLIHRCNNPACTEPDGVLPFHIVDYEIYRYLPSVVVSTVDKFALVGWNIRVPNLFGAVGGKCPVHGYLWTDKACEVPGCSNEPVSVSDEERCLLAPTLQVQDELHLIKEDLGTFASHYEGFLARLQEKIAGRAWKIVASTATIRDHELHVQQLYARGSTCFPAPGPLWDESFYAQKDVAGDGSVHVGRYFVGVMPNNKTHINATVELLWYYHREIQHLRRLSGSEGSNLLGLSTVLSDADWQELLDEYEVTITYSLTRRGGDQIAESIASQVNVYLTRDGYEEIRNEMLTGGTGPDTLNRVMDELEHRYKEQHPMERIRSITATSMISHGVDVSRFNFIMFFGMPRQTAEYIQASSRVGRQAPGISFVCFAAGRERDRSHYRYFHKYHEYLERLVEPPAVNRWAKFSVDRTASGLFMGLIFAGPARDLRENLYRSDKVLKYHGILRQRERQFKDLLVESYGAAGSDGAYFRTRVEEKVDEFLDVASGNMRHSDFPYNLRPVPMRSLRDTEEAIPFTAEYAGVPRNWKV